MKQTSVNGQLVVLKQKIRHITNQICKNREWNGATKGAWLRVSPCNGLVIWSNYEYKVAHTQHSYVAHTHSTILAVMRKGEELTSYYRYLTCHGNFTWMEGGKEEGEKGR